MFVRIYNTLIRILYPLVINRYIKKRMNNGKEDKARFNERIGRPKLKRPEGKLIWLHGASVGESISMLPLINKLIEAYPDAHIMVTTGTITSAEVMAKRLPERAFHQYFPIDNPVFSIRFLKHWQPDLVLWFESEFWPGMLSSIKKKKIPLILINGRISNKSFKRWQQFDFISKELLSCFTLCMGQSEEDAYRLKVLGARNTICLGNIKYAALPLPLDKDKLDDIKKQIGSRLLWLAGSTHDDEEYRIGRIHKALKKQFPSLLTIIVPRHPNRGEDISTMLSKEFDIKTALRSKNEKIAKDIDIYIANTIGEMGIWYNISKITFIGGSLINFGGQNFIEPARERNAIIVGPHTHNFTDVTNRAKRVDALIQVKDSSELESQVSSLLSNPELLEARRSLAYNWASNEARVLDGIVDTVRGYVE